MVTAVAGVPDVVRFVDVDPIEWFTVACEEKSAEKTMMMMILYFPPRYRRASYNKTNIQINVEANIYTTGLQTRVLI